MIVNGGGHGLGPAHQDQVKLGVTLVHKVPGVLVLVPLDKLLKILQVKLVPGCRYNMINTMIYKSQ